MFEVQRISEREQHEPEKLMLRLENALLRLERQLPPSKNPKKRVLSVSVQAPKKWLARMETAG
ncbi:MAG: hypothetical protein FJ403_09660 [Verrucomicrobia bacterium]|nr:hypothetical protein [Verrucomicrobiota bacterium]